MSETPPEAEPSTPPISASNRSTTNNSNSWFKSRGKKKAITNYKFKGADEDMKEHVFQTHSEGHRKHDQFDKTIEHAKHVANKSYDMPQLFEELLPDFWETSMLEPTTISDDDAQSRAKKFK